MMLSKTSARPSSLETFWRGFRRSCPRCGEGHMFSGYLTVRTACEVCGLATGERMLGDRAVPVFNAMARLQASEFQTFVCFIRCESRADLDALLRATAPGIGLSEDWTDSIRYFCLRCSYGAPHAHEEKDDSAEWQSERNLGIAAQSRKSVEKLLKDWASGDAGRHIDAIETRECTPPACEPGNTWWMSIDDEADDEAPDDDAE